MQKKKIWKMISNILEWTLLMTALAGGIGIIIPTMFHIVPYIVLSGSMEPEIQAGSIVYIDRNIKAEEIQEFLNSKKHLLFLCLFLILH